MRVGVARHPQPGDEQHGAVPAFPGMLPPLDVVDWWEHPGEEGRITPSGEFPGNWPSRPSASWFCGTERSNEAWHWRQSVEHRSSGLPTSAGGLGAGRLGAVSR